MRQKHLRIQTREAPSAAVRQQIWEAKQVDRWCQQRLREMLVPATVQSDAGRVKGATVVSPSWVNDGDSKEGGTRSYRKYQKIGKTERFCALARSLIRWLGPMYTKPEPQVFLPFQTASMGHVVLQTPPPTRDVAKLLCLILLPTYLDL